MGNQAVKLNPKGFVSSDVHRSLDQTEKGAWKGLNLNP